MHRPKNKPLTITHAKSVSEWKKASPDVDKWLEKRKRPKFAVRGLAQRPLSLLPRVLSLVCRSNQPLSLSRLTVSREGRCEDSSGQNSYLPIEEDSACPTK